MAASSVMAARTVSRNILWLLVGSGISQVLRVFYIAILARYLGAAGFGEISTATALTSMAILLVNFGLDTLAVRDMAVRPDRAGAYVTNVAFLRLSLTVAFAAVLTVVIGASPYNGETREIIAIYAVVYALDSLSDVARSTFSAFQRMQYRMAVDLARDFVNVGISLLGVYLGWPLVAIVAVSALASLVKLLLGFTLMARRFVRPILRIDLGLCGYLLASSLPFFSLVCISVLSVRLNVLILSWLDTSEAVGVYSAATFLVTTLLILADLFMESIFPVFSQYRDGHPSALARAYTFSYKVMLLLGFPLATGTILFSGHAISLLYGPGFESASTIASILAVQLFTMVGYVNGAFFNATNRQTLFALLRAGSVGLICVLSFILIPAYQSLGAALAIAIPAAVDFGLYSVLCHRFAGIPLPVATVLKAAVAAAMMGMGGGLALSLGIDVFVAVIVATGSYLAASVLVKIIGPEEWQFIRGLPLIKRLSRSPKALAA